MFLASSDVIFERSWQNYDIFHLSCLLKKLVQSRAAWQWDYLSLLVKMSLFLERISPNGGLISKSKEIPSSLVKGLTRNCLGGGGVYPLMVAWLVKGLTRNCLGKGRSFQSNIGKEKEKDRRERIEKEMGWIGRANKKKVMRPLSHSSGGCPCI